MTYAKKVDKNQAEIVKTGRKLGARIAITSSAGNGFPDTVWQYSYPNGRYRQKSGHETMLVEIKMPGCKLTPKQQEFHEIFNVHVIETIEDVYKLLEINYG